MLLSRNFLKDYVDLDDNVSIHDLAEAMTKVGNEYDSEGKLINATNLVIGEVLKCEKHPDSDHLHVCKVDTGDKVLQIVCGAPNCRKGLKVIVALPGAKLPGKDINKSTIRGVESNGMLCSIAELGLDEKFLKPEDKEGICELDNSAKPGEDPIKFLGLDDEVIDFDLTANRGDLLSIIGMAYEVGAIYSKKVKEIDLKHSEEKEETNFKVKIDTDNCKMFLAREVRNVKIEESPKEIKEKLIASGIRPINNVVDISNYVMLETGQPLHFYDADKLNGLIEVRMAEEGEKLTTLDSKERTLSKDDIVISDGKKAIGLAGVMGGLETEITENTKNIIVESAIFDSVKVRRTSNKILRSEASNRFEKGLDPNRTYMAMERACTLLEKYAYAKILKGMAKYDKTEKEPKKIDITNTKINKVLGSNIDIKDTINVLERLGFEVQQHVDNKDLLTVIVPTRRLDISIPEDLIEEVGRIYGVDNIEGKVMVLPLKEGTFDRKIRDIRNEMVDLGLSETLTYSLVNEKESSMFTLGDKESIKILSPLTEERSHLRQSLITSLYKIYEYNLARNISDVSIFEIGKAFYKDGESYNERNKLAALMTGKYIEGLHGKDVDFYVVKGIVEEVLDFLGYGGRYSFVQDNNKIPKDFHPGISAVISVNNDIVGVIGKLNPKICSKDVYAFEIDLDKLGEKRVSKMKYKEISKFPSVKKDIAVIVDKNVSASEMQKIIKSNGGKLLINNYVFDLYEGIGIPKGKKSIAFTLEIGAQDKTLTDEEIANVVTKITDALKKKYGAELRS